VAALRFSPRFAEAIAVMVGLGLSAAGAQSNADTAAVISANEAFYAALSKLDFAAMDKVWAHESYVFYIGPFHRSIIVGWPAVQAELQANKANVAEISVKPFETRVRINGDTAWLFGNEEGAALPKVGISASGFNIVTNIFEKKDGGWLMVGHHAQRIPN
jgi:ketosteroid isomerase-like protein